MTTLTTFRDLIDHLNDSRYGLAQDVEHRVLKRAVRAACRDLHGRADWSYLTGEYQLELAAPYSTGTIVYDHTGGSSERLVTLSDGTFPTWAAYGRIKIGTDIFIVDQYLTSTTITLDSVHNPGEDVASTTYKLYRNTYPLPADFKAMYGLHDSDTNSWTDGWVEPDEWMGMERNFGSWGEPFCWTIMGDPDNKGQLAIRTIGYPTTAAEIWFMYERHPVDPVLSGLETKATAGTVAVSGAAVTGTGTSFDSSMVGAVMRIDSSTSEPTGNDGLNPFASEHIIRSVESTTALTLMASADTVSGKGYIVSDLIDMSPNVINALLRGAEWQLAIIGNNSKMKQEGWGNYRDALRLAMQEDTRMRLYRSAASGGKRRYGLIGDRSDFDFGV